jgi:hypothetical protein
MQQKSKKALSNVIVHLQVFRGKILYNENGGVESDSQTLKIVHNTVEWRNFLKQFNRNGFSKFEVLSVIEYAPGEEQGKEIDKGAIFEELVKSVGPKREHAKVGSNDEALDLLKKQNELLMERLEALENGAAKQPIKAAKIVDVADEDKESENESSLEIEVADDELEALRFEFQKLYGKKADARFGIDKLKEAIAKKK